MAANIASSMKICDVTQCSICLEIFKEPKALPCIHTFCLKCLNNYCQNKEQEEVACPLCRKVFTIPPGGNKDLPNNFFILQLLQVKQAGGGAETEGINKPTLCELCSDSEREISSTLYCIECDQHICDRCSVMHTKAKVSRFHQVVLMANMPSIEERKKVNLSYCDQHPAEQNRLYCYDCKLVLCHVCFVDKHIDHKLTDVKKSAEKFSEQLKDDIAYVAACALKKQSRIEQLTTDISLFMKRMTTIEREISQKYDQLISFIQFQKNQLNEELNQFKDKILKDIETQKDEIERQFLIAESFKRYCLEIMKKGTSCDVSRTAHDLHARAEELVKTLDEPDSYALSKVEVTFKPTLATIDDTENFMGKLFFDGHTKHRQKCDFTKLLESLTVLHVMPSTGQPISGITVLGSEVFVTRCTSQVDVYQSDDLTLLRNLKITGSEKLRGIVACLIYNCLYVSDYEQKIIYRYDLTSGVITSWSVGGNCYRLSLTNYHNVLATLYETHQIQEYTTHGSLIKEISLNGTNSAIDSPRHCIQLSTGNYVVCHSGDRQHRVCIVDQRGHTTQSFGGRKGTRDRQMDGPYHLAVDKYDNVLVVDYGNNKIKLFDAKLNFLGVIVMPGHQLNNPLAVHVDEESHRLYIGEWTGKRMFVLALP